MNIDVESYSSFYLNDINQDGNLNLFVGQDLGGLFHLEVNPNSSASVAESKQDYSVALYPNPANEIVTIAFNKIQGTECTIRNMNSQVVQQSIIVSNKTLLNTSALPKGIYFVQIMLENGYMTIKKLVKN